MAHPFMETVATLGGESWFRLGDRDLALHVTRTERLRAGETLSQVTRAVCRRLGIAVRVLPMSDDPVRTRVHTNEGWLDFQDYFVRRQCQPVVRELVFDGVAKAHPQADVMAALASGTVRAVIICPSNPFISIEPILAVPGMRNALAGCGAPVVAVSPIVGGRAVKGPTAKMMQEIVGNGPYFTTGPKAQLDTGAAHEKQKNYPQAVKAYEKAADRACAAAKSQHSDGMVVFTQSEKTKDWQKAVMEFLLINHPLDCPICDQAGECKLQDYSFRFGKPTTRFEEEKEHGPKRRELGPHVMFDWERCIKCTRCIRFMDEVASIRSSL